MFLLPSDQTHQGKEGDNDNAGKYTFDGAVPRQDLSLALDALSAGSDDAVNISPDERVSDQ